jgi:broad specificity phosphatase PhoE
MQVVLIRHAKSVNYENNKRQSPTTRLGDYGIKQANWLARRIKELSDVSDQGYECVITSGWKRARQTAQIIAEKLNIPLTEDAFIHEYLSNKVLENQPLDSVIVTEFKKAVKDKGINFDWKFRGEGECLRDVINRAIKFRKNLIKEYRGKNVLVVSHGLFITTFITVLLLGDNYDEVQFDRVLKMIYLENASITHLEYNEEKGTWKIHCLNESGHLKPFFEN